MWREWLGSKARSGFDSDWGSMPFGPLRVIRHFRASSASVGWGGGSRLDVSRQLRQRMNAVGRKFHMGLRVREWSLNREVYLSEGIAAPSPIRWERVASQ
jgi:hypothetical protein